MRESSMETGNLNLARKWRSKNFDQIVGQDLSIKMLKNSLYLDRFFPVYLFSGQRGCGKTTTARVFAAAVNCHQLEAFRANPRVQLLPCNTCNSCQAMSLGKHPDFIEMDAASHTGVENVRNIVDAAGLLPVMGKKKIYLIDEAHMLSKAAFNAFLKILEEPPSSVLFILATTDAEKIIDTVRSRCFQLIFKSVNTQPLLAHLDMICSNESIKADKEALKLIIKETDGSVRDAINVLERVRFSSARVTIEAVRDVLGYLDDMQIIRLFEAVLCKQPADLIAFIKTLPFESIDILFIWRRLIDLIRTAIWLKNGVRGDLFAEYTLLISDITKGCSWMQLNHMLSTLYTHEHIFKQTTAQQSLLEMILLDFCQKYSINDPSDNNNSSAAPAQISFSMEEETLECDNSEEPEDDDSEDDEDVDQDEGAWPAFIQEVSSLADPLIVSIFKQSQLSAYNNEANEISLAFTKELEFFNEWLEQRESVWRPILEKHFGAAIKITLLFSLEKKIETSIEKTVVVKKDIVEKKAMVVTQSRVEQNTVQRFVKKKQHYQSSSYSLGKKMSSDELSAYTQMAMVLKYFPGDVYELLES